MENQLVSIIIPTYKRFNSLKITLDSALRQTYKNIEILVVDDNDPNSSYRAQVESFMATFKNNGNIIYLKHSHNMNGATARNTGLNQSKGEFVTFLDDDDKFLPLKVTKQVEFLNDNKQFDAVYCGRIQKGKKIVSKLQGNLSKELLLLEFTPTTPSLMFRKKALLDIKGFDVKFKRHQDYDLLLRFFENHNIGCISEILVVIGDNQGENEIHGKKLEINKEVFFQTFDTTIRTLSKFDKKFRTKLFVNHYTEVFWDHISQFHIILALKLYMKGFILNPLFFNFALIQYLLIYFKRIYTKSNKFKAGNYDKAKK